MESKEQREMQEETGIEVVPECKARLWMPGIDVSLDLECEEDFDIVLKILRKMAFKKLGLRAANVFNRNKNKG